MTLVSPIEVAEAVKINSNQRQVEDQESHPSKGQNRFQKRLRFVQLDVARLEPENATEDEPVGREAYATSKEEHALGGTFVDSPPSFKFLVSAKDMLSETDNEDDVCDDS